MPNQFLSDEFGDIEDYFVTDYWLIDQFVGDTLWVFGRNNVGQLGTNDVTFRSIPVTTFAGGNNWKQVSIGQDHAAAIKTDGTLWVWGNAGSGRLGTNDTTNRSTPVTTFAGGNDWKSVSFGFRSFAAAIKTDGSLWTWGSNNNGQLGVNNTTDRSTPVTTFAGGNNWKSISSGGYHTAAIKTDGTLWVWGAGGYGQLGNFANTNRNTPVTTFAGGTTWKQVSCGEAYTAAIKTDGSLWTWGRNNAGQLSVNDTINRNTPVTTFAGGNNWKSVDGNGNGHTAAVKTDGSLWLWGLNGDGQLGDFSTTQRNTPVTTFAGGNNWKSVDCGDRYTAAIKTDGTLWVWGRNSYSQLGNNASGNRSTPVTTFAGGNNWKSASCGYQHTAAIKSGLNVDLS
jgi:alpha-tubulin suppressor-like RCC1 family protein